MASDSPISSVGPGADKPPGSSSSSPTPSSVPGGTEQQNPPVSPDGADSEQSQVGEETLKETSELLNETARVLNKDIRFNVLPDQDVVQAEIVNRETDEVIREIPPDEILEVRKTLDAFIGLFIDELR
jgi:flagellar protein FlaG